MNKSVPGQGIFVADIDPPHYYNPDFNTSHIEYYFWMNATTKQWWRSSRRSTGWVPESDAQNERTFIEVPFWVDVLEIMGHG